MPRWQAMESGTTRGGSGRVRAKLHFRRAEPGGRMTGIPAQTRRTSGWLKPYGPLRRVPRLRSREQCRVCGFAELAVESREAVLQRLLARVAHRKLHRLQGEAARRERVAQPMLMMDGERLGRLAHDLRRAAAEVEDAPPCRGGLLIATFATAEHGRCAQGFGTRRQIRAWHLGRPRKRGARLPDQPAALV